MCLYDFLFFFLLLLPLDNASSFLRFLLAIMFARNAFQASFLFFFSFFFVVELLLITRSHHGDPTDGRKTLKIKKITGVHSQHVSEKGRKCKREGVGGNTSALFIKAVMWPRRCYFYVLTNKQTNQNQIPLLRDVYQFHSRWFVFMCACFLFILMSFIWDGGHVLTSIDSSNVLTIDTNVQRLPNRDMGISNSRREDNCIIPFVCSMCVKDWQLKSSDFSAVQGSMGESSGALQGVSFVVSRYTLSTVTTVSAECSVSLDAWPCNGSSVSTFRVHCSTTTPYIFTVPPP